MSMHIPIKRSLSVTLTKFWSSYPMNSARLYTIFGLIFLGMMSRLLPHPPNFTAINAVALFSACALGNLGICLFTVFIVMLLSDLVFGFHSSMVFVYLSLGLTILMGHWLNSNRTVIRITSLLVASSFLFFFVTNFGVWLVSPFYPKTLEGLGLCYVAAIPFHVNDTLGTLSYGAMLFGSFALAEHYIPAVSVRNHYAFD